MLLSPRLAGSGLVVSRWCPDGVQWCPVGSLGVPWRGGPRAVQYAILCYASDSEIDIEIDGEAHSEIDREMEGWIDSQIYNEIASELDKAIDSEIDGKID